MAVEVHVDGWTCGGVGKDQLRGGAGEGSSGEGHAWRSNVAAGLEADDQCL